MYNHLHKLEKKTTDLKILSFSTSKLAALHVKLQRRVSEYKFNSQNGLFSVLYKIRMSFMLRMSPKSTHHVTLVDDAAEIAHWPPPADRSLVNPSTALLDEESPKVCQVGLFNARLTRSENISLNVN